MAPNGAAGARRSARPSATEDVLRRVMVIPPKVPRVGLSLAQFNTQDERTCQLNVACRTLSNRRALRSPQSCRGNSPAFDAPSSDSLACAALLTVHGDSR